MLIHTSTLEKIDFENAATEAGVKIERFNKSGSKSRDAKFDIILSGNGRQGGQWGTQEHKSATYDQWGIFLQELFKADPEMIIPSIYWNLEHFEWTTDYRYRNLTLAEDHNHKWGNNSSVTDAYYVRDCKCGAVTRILKSKDSYELVFGS